MIFLLLCHGDTFVVTHGNMTHLTCCARFVNCVLFLFLIIIMYSDFCCVRISEDILKEYYLINVYLPYECTDNTDEFNDCLAKLNVFIDSINSTCVTILGDFNANLSRASSFGDILLKFCVDNSIDIVDHATLSNDTYTYAS